MHYVEMAPPAECRGTVVCVHGFPDTWYGWRHQIRSIASEGYHVIVPDQLGYGETDCPSEISSYGMKFLTEHMAALLDVLGLKSAVFLGHDWGGTLVWNMAMQYPDRVSAVGSVCTPPYPVNPKKNPW
jgi:soluble epoxide hydrolase/lipid-phosphate phosphatase